MAHWGIAYVVGPNYNYAWDAFDPASLAGSLASHAPRVRTPNGSRRGPPTWSRR